MKKIFLVMILMLNVHALDKRDWYLGIGFLSGTGEQTFDASGVSTTASYDTSGADIKFGTIFETDNRLEFSASSIDLEFANSTTTIKGRELDWIFTSSLNNENSAFLAFVSVGFGRFTMDGADTTGVSAQAALGGYLRLDQDYAIEFSYKNKLIFWSDVGTSTNIIDELTNYYIGLKYKF